MQLFRRLRNAWVGAVRSFKNEAWNKIPDNRSTYNEYLKNPYFRRTLIECSIKEDEENSYYSGILNTLSEHCCGSVPLIVGSQSNNRVNDAVEDAWFQWAVCNSIGSTIREVRRAAARTGIGIAIPSLKRNSVNRCKLAFKTVSFLDLESPRNIAPGDRIYDGIQYDKYWEIEKIFVKNYESEPFEYDAKDIIIWHKKIKEGMVGFAPECGPALILYPSIKRYMEAIIKSEEFRASIPTVMELDPTVWGKEVVSGQEPPKGRYLYEPGTVPTLPPGVKLSSIPVSVSGEERIKFVELVNGAAARCIQMPKNLALGDSSNHNMASSQVDLQPWANKIMIDRCDFEPVTRRIFMMWADYASALDDEYLPRLARAELKSFKYSLSYDALFVHPDPNKNASARATDLISGATTLVREYKKLGLNARRELERDAALYGITFEQYMQTLLATRTTEFLKIIGEINEQNQDIDEEPIQQRSR